MPTFLRTCLSYLLAFSSVPILLSCNGGGKLESTGLRDTLGTSIEATQVNSSTRMSSQNYVSYHQSGSNLIPGILSSSNYQQIDPMLELELNRLDLLGIGIFNENLPEPRP